jgi:hypothetical protein
VGEWLKLPECTFTAPEGMEFDAWQKGEQKAAPGEEVYLDSEAVTITALWKEKEPEPDDPTKPWTITFDANGGTGAMDPVTVPKAEGGTTYTLPACGFTAPEGKTFQAARSTPPARLSPSPATPPSPQCGRTRRSSPPSPPAGRLPTTSTAAI